MTDMGPSILFLNHPEQNCGVHEFGLQILGALTSSTQFNFVYQEIKTQTDLQAAVDKFSPAALIVNWHHITMRGIPTSAYRATKLPVLAIMHELDDNEADRLDQTLADAYLVHIPTLWTINPRVFICSRPILPYTNNFQIPEKLTIGTFGFATSRKDFEGLVSHVHSEFDECVIRMHIPSSDFCDPQGEMAKRVVQNCSRIIRKPGVKIEASFSFLPIPSVLDFLAQNSMNVFFYHQGNDRDISSAADLALAVDRPIALRRAQMFKHFEHVSPSIFVNDRSLKEILKDGIAPLQKIRRQWTMQNVLAEYEQAIRTVVK